MTWRQPSDTFTCSIINVKRGTKLHGMKSVIAYNLITSVSPTYYMGGDGGCIKSFFPKSFGFSKSFGFPKK